MRELRFNTVPATQAGTRLDERLGRSNGRPGQTFQLQKKPVLIDPLTGLPDLELTLIDQQGRKVWTRVESFFAQGPEETVYVLDPTTGTATFGDGRNGQIPVAGTDIVASHYRYGGGKIGNVCAKHDHGNPGQDHRREIGDQRPCRGEGSDPETLEKAKLRAPHDLRTRDRAVTAEDFAYLARQTPTVAVHKAYALARRIPDNTAPSGFTEKDGAVALVILPANKATDSHSRARRRCARYANGWSHAA